jgi:hypothetical protein
MMQLCILNTDEKNMHMINTDEKTCIHGIKIILFQITNIPIIPTIIFFCTKDHGKIFMILLFLLNNKIMNKLNNV